MLKHLSILHEFGEACIASAGKRPVGAGWSPENRRDFESKGFCVKLREESTGRFNPVHFPGMAYGIIFKSLGFEKSFGHANPYHRRAFSDVWWREVSKGYDLAVIHYSYWARLPCDCPKVVVLHDLLSDTMRGGWHNEVEDLNTADLIVVISKNEEETLRKRGLTRVLWSPPAVDEMFDLPESGKIALIGSENLMNKEGLLWLGPAMRSGEVRVYGSLANHIKQPGPVAVGRYNKPETPYRDCGIILIPTTQGTGVQIKCVEALAAGRAIVARRGAMRGIPWDEHAWIEVDTPHEMMEWARKLSSDKSLRASWGVRAREYHRKYLCADMIRDQLRAAYQGLARA
jgi:hypothetical protein